MSDASRTAAARPQRVFILAGNSTQYTAARQRLGLEPGRAFWLTRPSDLTGHLRPKVYRAGTWKALPKLAEIEQALAACEAEVSDLE